MFYYFQSSNPKVSFSFSFAITFKRIDSTNGSNSFEHKDIMFRVDLLTTSTNCIYLQWL